jgi:hypothetical protein
VADTFDALTTNRPYQQAHDPQEALRIIRSLSGKRLDPAAAAALIEIYQRGDISVQRVPAPFPIVEAGATSDEPAAEPLRLPETSSPVEADTVQA